MPVPSEPKDEALVRSIAAGDESALARAFDAHGGLVHGLALRMLRNPGDAEEVSQDVFFQLWRTASRFDTGRGNLVGYLVAITRNRAIDRLRARRGRPAAVGVVDPADFPSEAENPAAAAGAGDARVRAVAALGGLPVEERRVLEMAYFDGLSQSEIADRTSTPLGTVKGRTRNALVRLRALLPASLGGAR